MAWGFRAWISRLLSFGVSVRSRLAHKYRFGGGLVDLPDVRDLVYAVGDSVQEIKSYGGVEEFVSGVKSQQNANSCVPHAAGLLFEVELRKKGVEFDVSERQLYYDGRKLGGLLPKDVGMYPRDVLKVMRHQGVIPEKLCPYDTRLLNEEPSLLGQSFMPFFRIKSYHQVFSVRSVKAQLDEGHAVMVNLPFYDSFRDCTGWYGVPTEDRFNGYHQVAIIAHDEELLCPDGSLGAFLIQNSWGQRWGKHGRAWIGYQFFSKELPGSPSPMKFYSIKVA